MYHLPALKESRFLLLNGHILFSTMQDCDNQSHSRLWSYPIDCSFPELKTTTIHLFRCFFFLFGLLTLKTLFNMTSLQKSIKVKDCVIKRLHEELVELRGPLPDDTNSEVTGETSVAGSVGKHDKPQWSKVACSSDWLQKWSSWEA